jgi:hypothetical protein
VAEVLGGLGLVLPGLLRIRPELTPLAAAGLVVIMVGPPPSRQRRWRRAGLFPLLTGYSPRSSPTAAGSWRRIGDRPPDGACSPSPEHREQRDPGDASSP